MQSLKNVVATLRQEILAALDEPKNLPAGARLEAERFVLSLAVTLQEKQGNGDSDVVELLIPVAKASSSDNRSDGQAVEHTPPSLHTLTIEFRLASAARAPGQTSGQPEREALAQKPANSVSPSPDPVVESLTAIFGVPGFDSSARATVFREALTGISDDQARAIADSLRGMPTPGITPAAARARSLVERLVVSAPAGPPRGREVLAEVFHRHSVQSLLGFIRERWKTQEEWLNEPAQRSNAGSAQPSRRRGSDI